MTMAASQTEVRQQVTVAVPAEKAFAFFTERFDDWWPMSHHIGAEMPEARVIEPGVGGRWLDRAEDGTECVWGSVLAWEPPRRLVLSWAIDGNGSSSTPTRRTPPRSRSRSRRTARGTRVELVHRHLDRHGETWPALARAVAADGGWPTILAAVRGRASTCPRSAPRSPSPRRSRRPGGSTPSSTAAGTRRTTSSATARPRPWSSSRARAAAGTRSRPTARSRSGAGCWPGEPPQPAGAVLDDRRRTGSRTRTRRTGPRSRCCSRRWPAGPGSTWSTATSAGSATRPRRSTTGVAHPDFGHPYYLRRFAAAAEGRPVD